MAITLKDIAERCNVSRMAVSQVLGNPDNTRFSAKTRKHIVQVAKELDYTPNILARHLKRGRTHLLSMVIPFNDPGMMDTVEQTAQELGYSLMVQFTPSPDVRAEHAAIQAALERRVDGIIWQPASPGNVPKDIVGMLESADTNVVLLQSPEKELPDVDVVYVDYEDAYRQALSHLILCGYQKIVNVSYDLSFELRNRRMKIFRHLTEEMKIDSDVLIANRGNIAPIISEYLDTHDGRIGFFGQDFHVLDIVDIAEEKGRSIPEELGIVILGDIKFGGRGYRVGEVVRPKLTAMQVPAHRIAETAVKYLVDRIRGRATGPARQTAIHATLIERQSTAQNSGVGEKKTYL